MRVLSIALKQKIIVSLCIKNDIDEWMGDITHIKVFTIEGGTPNPFGLYRKLTRAFIDVIKADRAKWY